MSKNYYGIRIKGGTGITQEDDCFKNDRVVLGWSSINLEEELIPNKIPSKIKEVLSKADWYKNNRSIGQAIGIISRVLQVNKGDIIITPRYKLIAIAEVLSDHIQYDNSKKSVEKDIANYYSVKWIHKEYPKSKLTSAFISSCKFQQTVVSLDYYKDEIEKAMSDKSIGAFEKEYEKRQEILAESDIQHIYRHIEDRENIYFSDDDFELFIKHVFEIAFNLDGKINSKRNEKITGRDIILTVNDLNEIQWNVQVKQHRDQTGEQAVRQILKGNGKNQNNINIVVSNTDFSSGAKKLSAENNVVLIDGQKLAEIIYEHFDAIEKKFKTKLNLFKALVPDHKKNIGALHCGN